MAAVSGNPPASYNPGVAAGEHEVVLPGDSNNVNSERPAADNQAPPAAPSDGNEGSKPAVEPVKGAEQDCPGGNMDTDDKGKEAAEEGGQASGSSGKRTATEKEDLGADAKRSKAGEAGDEAKGQGLLDQALDKAAAVGASMATAVSQQAQAVAAKAAQAASSLASKARDVAVDKTRETVLYAEGEGQDKLQQSLAAGQERAEQLSSQVAEKAATVKDKTQEAIGALAQKGKEVVASVNGTVVEAAKNAMLSAAGVLKGVGHNMEQLAQEPPELEQQVKEEEFVRTYPS